MERLGQIAMWHRRSCDIGGDMWCLRSSWASSMRRPRTAPSRHRFQPIRRREKDGRSYPRKLKGRSFQDTGPTFKMNGWVWRKSQTTSAWQSNLMSWLNWRWLINMDFPSIMSVTCFGYCSKTFCLVKLGVMVDLCWSPIIHWHLVTSSWSWQSTYDSQKWWLSTCHWLTTNWPLLSG